MLAICLGALGVCAIVAAFIERRSWFRERAMYVDEAPREDDRSSITIHRRILDTRDTL
ncbi:MAG: hypothetical protein H6826_13615 [Planctomycetes bacterium]|nr:hypothetical protein [Planctomycetota bacterium]